MTFDLPIFPLLFYGCLPMTRFYSIRILIALSFVLTLGCSRSAHPGTAKVAGTLTYNGLPVDGASVIFSPASGGKPATGTTDAQGRFQLSTFGELDGAVPGEYKVTVQKTKTEQGVDMTDEERYELMKQGKPVPGPVTTNLLPEKYASGTTTDLSVTVKPSDNDIPVALTD